MLTTIKHPGDMKAKQSKHMNLFEGGKNEWEETDEYKEKVSKIIEEVTDRYSAILLSERNWIKRFLIKLRRKNEIGRKINELSSSKNLHTKGSSVL